MLTLSEIAAELYGAELHTAMRHADALQEYLDNATDYLAGGVTCADHLRGKLVDEFGLPVAGEEDLTVLSDSLVKVADLVTLRCKQDVARQTAGSPHSMFAQPDPSIMAFDDITSEELAAADGPAPGLADHFREPS